MHVRPLESSIAESVDKFRADAVRRWPVRLAQVQKSVAQSAIPDLVKDVETLLIE